MAFYQFVHHDKKFIALFNPKCACTTLKTWFADSLEEGQIEDDQELNVHRIPTRAIARYPSYKKFFFVRSPYDRLVSFYCSFIVDSRETADWGFADDAQKVSLEGHSFAEFVHILASLARSGTRLQHHLVPQRARIEAVVPDRVIRTDDLDIELPLLSRELGFEYAARRLNANRYVAEIQEPVADRSPDWFGRHGTPHYAFFYNDALRSLVENLYPDDVACYGLRPGENPYSPVNRNRRIAR